ncbi:cysteine--tRNA ligase [Rhodosalinus halophilus]|uniref:Cysteine--tRNA ligase n=1 Tax=Rhodosalinus halophilus TaxID=2259333 RepID=A0A365U4U8_9RHOB|nr:cysteine--tRNA ligase [Rhodosalinus halophilus]RBI82857.1 cysteine--tRNA ligase [Rhodosalinus halophilus]
MTEIHLTNTRTRTKERFEPLDPANVRMYVCGPTVYDRAHLGNARPAVVFDVLYRLLRHVAPENGWGKVTYVRNITDVEDKIIDRARERGIGIDELTRTTTEWYHQDMAALGVLPPTREPHATGYIPQMVEMIEALIARGCAYAAEGHVLFSVESYPDYGRLSGRSVEDMVAGARVEVAPYKKNPMDFVLWKPSAPDEPGWESPWGRGRPGWHIECSAMSHALLGASFDIHGGGADLMFPHHENEVAQSCCAHPEGSFARYWLHNEMLQVEGKKMSKSLGNFFTVRDLLEGNWSGGWKVPGEVIRFVFLGTHYRKPMDWTEEKAREAQGHLGAWHRLKRHALSDPKRVFTGQNVDPQVVEALADDLNTPVIFQRRLFELARDAKMSSVDSAEVERFFETLAFLGLHNLDVYRLERQQAVGRAALETLQQTLVAKRAEAMRTKDFSEVDRMKAALVAAGVEVRMSKAGVELLPAAGFDPAKLEALEEEGWSV